MMYSEQERKELFPKALFLSDLVEGQTYYQVNVGRILPFVYGGHREEDSGIRIDKHSIDPNGKSETWYATDAGLEPYTSGYNDLNMIVPTEEDAIDAVNNSVYRSKNDAHRLWVDDDDDDYEIADYLSDYDDYEIADYNDEFDHGDY